MARGCTVRIPLVVALLLLAPACRSEPAPTVQAPPNPTTAPATVLTGCTVDQGSPQPVPSTGPDYKIVQPGVLVAGSVTNLPPFESIQSGSPVGFDVAVVAEIARRLGLRPQIQAETASTLLTDVAHGKTDVAISAISIRSDRKAAVDFTDPYYTADLA